MKLHIAPPSPRAIKVVALKNNLGLECEIRVINFSTGDHMTPEYAALNPNKLMPVLEDDGFVLWESNAILQYLASKRNRSAACGLRMRSVSPTCSDGCRGRVRIGRRAHAAS
jgi:glutathione S-transferase